MVEQTSFEVKIYTMKVDEIHDEQFKSSCASHSGVP